MTASIEAMAREAGLFCDKGHWFSPAGDPEDEVDVSTEDLARFAAIARAQALEDAAQVCDEAAGRLLAPKRVSQVDAHTAEVLASKAAAIRALKAVT